ncbi:hypothetical protein [Pantoea stewartii]|uniref:Uncharacterized protein n=1 Tax=Pantoea stewartii TaxID=66269 RepID=A0AB34VDT6_9GAMM|nr:hypothetical protein [Pantoea stewartii]KTS28522.1 hypothetical protein NS381_08455 [Pantoea stewartii]KTS76031.1 hypothetical protein RSA30_00280 [Pantoea stewartii]KTS96329.1 hypothetical protein RSA13_14090 [Pantoea stewartii]KTT07645.1 hypothetical protein RSA36_10170 [Pantoea stewartii]UYK98163.1 hypothetical protein NG832_03780 [Pantoea stewartii]
MKISRLAISRLKKVKWFVNVGKASSLQNIRHVTNESDFIKHITSIEWENATIEAGNEITGYLAKKYTKEYQEWNSLVREAKDIISKEIIPLMKTINGIEENVILDNVKWDLVNFLMEDYYKEYLKGDLFFASLIEVYEDGHIPCGLEGKWPSGKLVIY